MLKETTLRRSFCLTIGIMFFTSLYSQEIDLKKQAIDEFENENYSKATRTCPVGMFRNSCDSYCLELTRRTNWSRLTSYDKPGTENHSEICSFPIEMFS